MKALKALFWMVPLAFLGGFIVGVVPWGGRDKCEIETSRRISPAMTVVCYDPDHLRCDTTFTYREP